jgi:hypothetical protein
MRLFARSPSQETFVAEATDTQPSRRALLHAACACGALGLLRPVAALAQAQPAAAAGPTRAIHGALDQPSKAG